MRAPCVDKNGMKKGSWSEEEDNKLRAYILRYGHWNWRLLPKFAGLARCGKSCRLRWVNYLKPGLKRGNFTKEEKQLITKLHHQIGNKWSAIAAKLPGRTDNEIKNYWHTHLKNRAQNVGTLDSSNLQEFDIPVLESLESESESGSVEGTNSAFLCEKRALHVAAESYNGQNGRESLFGSLWTDQFGSFWTDQFVVDTNSYIQPTLLSHEEDFFSGYVFS